LETQWKTSSAIRPPVSAAPAIRPFHASAIDFPAADGEKIEKEEKIW